MITIRDDEGFIVSVDPKMVYCITVGGRSLYIFLLGMGNDPLNLSYHSEENAVAAHDDLLRRLKK